MKSKTLDANIELIFNSATDSEMLMKVSYDQNSTTDFVAFVLMDGVDSDLFHLNKNQTEFLIDFLKRLHQNMEDEI